MAVIGIDVSRANSKRKTGTEWYSFYLTQYLKAYVLPGIKYRLYAKEALHSGLEILPDGWEARILAWGPKRFWNQLRLSWELWKNPVDTFFQPTHTLPLFKPRRTIVTLHDIGFERMPQLYGKAELRYHRHSAKLAIRRANHILTVSEFSKSELMDVYGVDAGRITVTHLGIDHARYHANISQEERGAALKEYRLSRPFFLYVGRLEEKKNIVNLIHAFSIFKGWRGVGDPVKLFLAGNPGFGYARIKAEIAARHMEEHVVLPGYVPEASMPALMAEADALTFPTWYEGFGLPIVQAQAVGTPVITSSVASMPEVAGDGALLVHPGAPEEIALAMKEIASGSTKREQLIARGLENAKRFTWDSTAQKTMNVILEISGIQQKV